MKQKPGISCIISCYNDGIYLKECLDSLDSIDIQKKEVIIVNDGSTDNQTIDILNNLDKNKFKLINKENGGVSSARNCGIEEAQYEFLFLVDADDKIGHNFIEKAYKKILSEPKLDIVYGNYQRFENSDTFVKSSDYNTAKLLSGNFIIISSLFRKNVWEKVGGFDTSLKFYEDWEFWIKAASIGANFSYLDELALYYRHRKNSRNSIANDPEQREKVINKIVENNVDIYKDNFQAVIAFLHRTIAANEAIVTADDDMVNIIDKNKRLAQEIEDLKKYYEKSFFWKLKLLAEKIKRPFR